MFKAQQFKTFFTSSAECQWEPSQEKVYSSNLYHFIKAVNLKFNLNITNFEELYRWSIGTDHLKNVENFWSFLWDYTNIKSTIKGNIIAENLTSFENVKWFPEAKLNFAENILRKKNNDNAILFKGENILSRNLTWLELNQNVSKIQQFLIENNIKTEDRIALFIPNIPEAIVFLLAASSIGAICTFCSPDFGVQGIIDRFSQVEPTVFVYSDYYLYNGKKISTIEKVNESLKRLPTIKKIVEISYFSEKNSEFLLSKNLKENFKFYHSILNEYSSKEISFKQLPFNHPLYIMYSSGTTGIPKCIVHGAGGTLLQHLKEHQLHCDFKSGDKVFYYTTCGWMMWQWLVSSLASECTVLLYDGSPFYPSPDVLFEYIDKEQARFFGTSAKFIDSIRKINLIPKEKYSFQYLDTIGSTGSPLVAESFDYVYLNIKQNICLSSLSGGTDIISCFVLGNPIGKVYRGEIQSCGLGMKVEVFSDEGKKIYSDKGELVCSLPFPSQPIYFWNDKDNSKYKASYFNKYKNVWHHGDWMEINDHGGIIIYGRSDSTLNPGGVRIGTAEIYRQVEQFDEIIESLAIDQKWGNDSRIILFVKMKEGKNLSDLLIQDIKLKLKINCSPRHIPAKIIAVPDIPKTKSGKIVEIAVKNIVNKNEVKNKESMANPDSLLFFENINELTME
ncbi:acetoacetate--CoA ligase [Silvanigrella paludirubra]|uniref:Acetoacetate--CoA ligase n=1 Tax=Silvanigrella paludirubra TaxID=2499159 RepID=A0A6N6VZH8_9BACT|nr:acetoacetate--CoA ligase [Silvanigrella paludirubra]KAB8040686.1 acetoacetate--CoA ligase [Silvanigrella paludirubra]